MKILISLAVILALGAGAGDAVAISCMDPSATYWGDVNFDGVVSIRDISLVASFFGEQVSGPVDITNDGVVSILDISFVASVFGETC